MISGLTKARLKGLIPFLSVGDPTPDLSLRCLKIFAENGADALELGVPFTDPVADGKLIQKSACRSIRNNVTVVSILNIIKILRRNNNIIPLVLMSYVNPIREYGLCRLSRELMECKTGGLLLTDCSTESILKASRAMRVHGLKLITLISPTTPPRRMLLNGTEPLGYLYCVSLQGTTGSDKIIQEKLRPILNFILTTTSIPACIGFGIKDEPGACALSKLSDAVIIGSHFINLIDILFKNLKQSEALNCVSKEAKKFRDALGLVGLEPTANRL